LLSREKTISEQYNNAWLSFDKSQLSVLISGSVALNIIFYPLIETLAPAQAWIEA